MPADDDLYSGYDDGPRTAAAADPFEAASPVSSAFQPLDCSSSYSPTGSVQPPGTAMRGGTASSRRMGTAMRTGTASSGMQARPMTSNRAAGYSSRPAGRFIDGLDASGKSSPSGQAGAGSSLLAKKQQDSAEEVARGLEKTVHDQLEASVSLLQQGSTQAALDAALDCRKRERALARTREESGQGDAHPPELALAVGLQLASCYAASQLYSEALEQYNALIKSKALAGQAGRLRVNVGNIHYQQGRYPAAIRQYRMALDALPAAAAVARARLTTNIGLAFVQLGQYGDAAGAFETALDMAPDHQAAFNLLVCTYALGDTDGMTSAFARLLGVPGLAELEKAEEAAEHAAADTGIDDDDSLRDSIAGGMRGRLSSLVAAAGPVSDTVKQAQRQRHAAMRRCVLTGAQVLAEGLAAARGGFAAGFDWAAEQLRVAGLPRLAAEVLLAKAARHLAAKEVEAAASVFKSFEHMEPSLRAAAATNLSFLYLLEGDLAAAARYTDLALKTDRYNAQAHVNRGVVLLEGGNLEDARQAFCDAAAIQPLCVQALYNLGIVNLRLGEPASAMVPLRKLHNLLPDQPEVVHCLALAADMSGDSAAAIRWLQLLSSLVPHDPGVLCKLGAIHHKLDKEARSMAYYADAHRAWPVNLDVISWLGAFHVRNEVYEAAAPYFELAAAIQPAEAKWALMTASCYRRTGAYDAALAQYQAIVEQHPDNVEALRYLVALCQELGWGEQAEHYSQKLRRAERAEAAAAAAAAAVTTSSSAAGLAPQQQLGDSMAAAASGGLGSLDEQLAKRTMRPAVAGAAGRAAAGGDDAWDDNGVLGEDLLPM